MRLDELRAGLQAWLADPTRTAYAVHGGRVYYEPFPQGATFPILTFSRLPGSGYHTFGRRATPLYVTYQVTAWSKPFEQGGGGLVQAEQMLSLVMDELDGHSGLTGGVTIEGSKLLTVNPELVDPDSGLHHCSADFEISFAP